MRYFYDTEFHEDGRTIDLISIGIVAEDGREFYAVSYDADYTRIVKHPWLMDNVMNSIEHNVIKTFGGDSVDLLITDEHAMTRRAIREELIKFIGNDFNAELWAYYADYDHVALSQLFGTMLNLPSHFPMYTLDIKQHWVYKGKPQMPRQADGEHNALDDARHNKVMFDYLESL